MRGLGRLGRGRPLILVALVVAGALSGVVPATAAPPPRTLVATDGTGDWGHEVNAGLGPVGAALGQDLFKAWISAGRGTISFTLQLKGLPPTGVSSVPTAYQWDFMVDGAYYRIQTCEPDAAAECPLPPAGASSFVLRKCDVAFFTGCETVGAGAATVVEAQSTVTYPVDMKVVGARPGSAIAAGTLFGAPIKAFVGTASVAQAYTALPHDEMLMTRGFYVPER